MSQESLEEAPVVREETGSQLPPESGHTDEGIVRVVAELVRQLDTIASVTIVATRKDGSLDVAEHYVGFRDALLHQAVLNNRVEVHRTRFFEEAVTLPIE